MDLLGAARLRLARSVAPEPRSRVVTVADQSNETLAVRDLRLDASNPRLPEHLRGADQSRLLEYLHATAALDELAKSFVDNGFFPHEPLIVSQPDDGGRHDVLEGNRRLAALTILLGLPATEQVSDVEITLDPPPTSEQLAALHSVPCVIVDNREDVRGFIGFRHIGGIKAWGAEAKARYLLAEVRRAHTLDSRKNPFLVVARAVGSNSQGVRNPYIAMRILIHGREHFGIDITAIQRSRFGVWNRAMNSPDLRSYIGFGDARTFEEIEAALEDLQEGPLREVLGDMTPATGSKRAVLGDSRDVTIYAQILQNERAHKILRQYDDLGLARQIVDQASVPQRIRQVVKSIDILMQEISRQGAPQDSLEPAHELAQLAQSLYDLVNVKLNA